MSINRGCSFASTICASVRQPQQNGGHGAGVDLLLTICVLTCFIQPTQSSTNRSAVRYSIVGGNADSAFSINPGSGVIATRGGHGGAGPLDFERARFYNLTVDAKDY